ncbi:p40 [Providence virus]|nr:p40 [Providence virus]ADG04364.1 p40 [Providence virus]AOF39954.1 p40 [Providence virus]
MCEPLSLRLCISCKATTSSSESRGEELLSGSKSPPPPKPSLTQTLLRYLSSMLTHLGAAIMSPLSVVTGRIIPSGNTILRASLALTSATCFYTHLRGYRYILRFCRTDLVLFTQSVLNLLLQRIGLKSLRLSLDTTISLPFVIPQFVNIVDYAQLSQALQHTRTHTRSATFLNVSHIPDQLLRFAEKSWIRQQLRHVDLMGPAEVVEFQHWLSNRLVDLYPTWRPLLAALGLIALAWCLTPVARVLLEEGEEKDPVVRNLTAVLRSHAIFCHRTAGTRRMLADRASAWLRKEHPNMEEHMKPALVARAVALAMIPCREEVESLIDQQKNSASLWWVTNLLRSGWNSPWEWLLGRTIPTK